MKKRTNGLSKLVFYVLLVVILMLAVTNYLTSFLYARYLSSDSSSDDGRVAVWDINFDDGGELNTIIPSTHLEYGSKGEYGLDIVNNSETMAKLSQSSSVKLRLYSPNLNLEHHHDSWDFLHDEDENPIDNPINFRVYLYNCSWKELNEEYLEDGEFNSSLFPNIKEYLILDTNDSINPLEFEIVIDNGQFYYETVVSLDGLNDSFNLSIGGGRICLRVVWNVDVVSGEVISKDNFVSYHMVKTTEFNSNKYVGIINKNTLDSSSKTFINLKDATSDVVESSLVSNAVEIEGIKYVVAYKEHDYFEYLIYSSSLGGEVMITFDDVKGIYIKRCTKLSDGEKNLLNNRLFSNVSTEKDLTRFIEKLEYESYQEYLGVKAQYEKTSGYVSLGIECCIKINFKVEQID